RGDQLLPQRRANTERAQDRFLTDNGDVERFGIGGVTRANEQAFLCVQFLGAANEGCYLMAGFERLREQLSPSTTASPEEQELHRAGSIGGRKPTPWGTVGWRLLLLPPELIGR